MTILRPEQDSKDLALIRIIKKNVIWFLSTGPQGSDSFFYHHHKRSFLRLALKVKFRSLKRYLDAVYALIEEDCVDPDFIDSTLQLCLCIIMGTTHMR